MKPPSAWPITFDNRPVEYRLGRRRSLIDEMQFDIVLQGAFEWRKIGPNGAIEDAGLSWRDIPIVDL